MKRIKGSLTASVLIFVVIGLAAGMSYGQTYDVWQCGQCNEFNCQGYDNQPMIHFYPFQHKIGELHRINLDAVRVLTLNPAQGGNLFCYLMWKVDNAPVFWFYFDSTMNLINWNVLFDTCTYSTDVTLQCVDFEDPTLASTYYVSDTITDSGQTMTLQPFQWTGGTWYSGGNAQIIVPDWCDAGGSGQELLLNNINIDFDFPVLEQGLTVNFGEYGGNVNIEINGAFMNESTFNDVVGIVGGVTVLCSGAGCTGGGTGRLDLIGSVSSLSIGGQEFCIDDVCPR